MSGDRKRIAIGGDVSTTVEVDLWGTLYTLAPATRSVLKKVEPLEAELEGVEDGDELVALFAKLFDLRLTAVNGGGKASTHIKKKWNADELTLQELASFAEALAETDRPT